LKLKKNELTDSERQRKEDIIRIQDLLKQGYQPVYIRQLTGHTYRTIRKYKTGDPDIMCRNPLLDKKKASKLDAYASVIIQRLSEGMMLKDIKESLLIFIVIAKALLRKMIWNIIQAKIL
jgi:hypothetical protein